MPQVAHIQQGIFKCLLLHFLKVCTGRSLCNDRGWRLQQKVASQVVSRLSRVEQGSMGMRTQRSLMGRWLWQSTQLVFTGSASWKLSEAVESLRANKAQILQVQSLSGVASAANYASAFVLHWQRHSCPSQNSFESKGSSLIKPGGQDLQDEGFCLKGVRPIDSGAALLSQ